MLWYVTGNKQPHNLLHGQFLLWSLLSMDVRTPILFRTSAGSSLDQDPQVYTDYYAVV